MPNLVVPSLPTRTLVQWLKADYLIGSAATHQPLQSRAG